MYFSLLSFQNFNLKSIIFFVVYSGHASWIKRCVCATWAMMKQMQQTYSFMCVICVSYIFKGKEVLKESKAFYQCIQNPNFCTTNICERSQWKFAAINPWMYCSRNPYFYLNFKGHTEHEHQCSWLIQMTEVWNDFNRMKCVRSWRIRLLILAAFVIVLLF